MTFWQGVASRFGAHRVLQFVRMYPPLFGAGIRVTRADRQLRHVEVALTLRWWNRNYVGTHFGGSLYAMCDPFYMLMVMENLGPGYVVWDKSATIDFLKPGRTRVHAAFDLDDGQLARIREEVATNGKSHPRFEVTVHDTAGDVVARVGKVLSVRPAKPPGAPPRA